MGRLPDSLVEAGEDKAAHRRTAVEGVEEGDVEVFVTEAVQGHHVTEFEHDEDECVEPRDVGLRLIVVVVVVECWNV